MNNTSENMIRPNEDLSIIDAEKGWKFIDFQELKHYRDLFVFLVWRNIKVVYAQTILGFSWAILQPLFQIVIFSIIFGRVAKVPSEGVPYFLFSTVAVIPWTYMSQAMTGASTSLVQGSGMLGKIYFPRLLFPVTPVLAKMVDFLISMTIVVIVMLYYRVMPTWNLLWVPVFIVMMISIPLGIGLWLSALAIRYRDVQHAMQFIVRMLIYSAPILYSASSIPQAYRFLYSLNPIVGVIEGFRACMLGKPVPWVFIWPGMITASLLLVTGVFYFRRMERIFADVI